MIHLALAGSTFTLHGPSRVLEAVRAHFAGFFVDRGEWQVEITEADPETLEGAAIPGQLALEIADKRARVRIGALPDYFPTGSVQNMMRLILVHDLAARGGLLLHAASTVEQGRALAFFGRSGAGKSTLARGFTELLSDEIASIDGDRVAHRAPFTGERLPPPVPLSAPLAALYAIERGPVFGARRLSEPEALRRLLTCVVTIGHDRALTQKLFDNAAASCSRVPVYAATFPRLPDDVSAARRVFAEWIP